MLDHAKQARHSPREIMLSQVDLEAVVIEATLSVSLPNFHDYHPTHACSAISGVDHVSTA